MDAFGSIAVATAITATLNFIAITAASMAASKLLAPKMPSYADSSLSERGQMVRSPIASRQIIYGTAKVSGVMVYISTTGTKNEYLHIVVALAGHQVEEIGDVYFGDELALTGAGSSAQGRFAGKAEIYKQLGGSAQVAQPQLVSATSGLTDGKWTNAHRLRGISYIYVQLTWDTEVFANGIPNISAIVKGKPVYDPRTTTTVWSANPALCLRDYLTESLGLTMDSSEIDDTAITAAANICEEQVQILPLSPTIYENRYECNGVLSTSESPDANIGKLLSAMGGLIAYSGGKIVPYAAGYRIPTVTLTEKHFASGISVQTRTSARDRVNAVKGVYVSEANQWQVSDFPSIAPAAYYSADNSVRYWRDVVLPFTTSSSCAQRLSVIELRRAREEITFTARFRLEAMQLRAGDTVMITNTKLGWSSKVFEVMEWHFTTDGNPPQIGVEMTMRETASTVYDWTVSDEVAVADAPNTTLPNPYDLSAPTNLTLTADGTTQLVQADGTAIPRIRVSWSAPAETFIQSGGTVGIEYKQNTATTYLTWSKVEGDQTLDFISSDVKIGLTYDVRIFGQSYFQVSTSYLSASVNVAKDTTAPSIPTSLTASVGTGKAVSLDWADNSEADFSEYGVYRKTTAVTPADANTDKIAELRSSRFVDTEVAIGTTYFYWVNAYDALENVSGFANYVQAIPTTVTAGADPTAPSTPSAPTFSSEANYLASDGTSFARITITVPAVPAGGVGLNVLYKVSGSSSFIIASQVNAAGAVSIDDLTPGVAYLFAVQAFSFNAILSTISSTLSRTAPTTSTVNAPTSVASSSAAGDMATVPPVFAGAGGAKYFAGVLKWTKSTSTDVAFYEMRTTSGGGGPVLYRPDASKSSQYYYSYNINIPTGEEWQIRAVSRSGATSAYVTDATFPGAITTNYGTANMAEQASSSVAITGGSTIGQSAVGATNFFANDASSGISGATTAIDVQNANFRVFSGTTQKLRIDYTNGEVYIQSSRVLSTRKTGWSTATGTATRTTFATSTVTTEQLAERVKALIDDLDSTAGHGLIGT